MLFPASLQMNVNSSYERSIVFIKVLIPEWLNLLVHYSIYCLAQVLAQRTCKQQNDTIYKCLKVHQILRAVFLHQELRWDFSIWTLMKHSPIHSLKQQHHTTAVFRLREDSCDCNTATFASTLPSATCHQQGPRLVAQQGNIPRQKVLSYGLRQQEAKDAIWF